MAQYGDDGGPDVLVGRGTVIAALRASDDLHAAFGRLQAAPDKQRQRWQDAITRIATERDRLRSQLRS
jgi:hypothetical protein